jgi:hypothetical protein
MAIVLIKRGLINGWRSHRSFTIFEVWTVRLSSVLYYYYEVYIVM